MSIKPLTEADHFLRKVCLALMADLDPREIQGSQGSQAAQDPKETLDFLVKTCNFGDVKIRERLIIFSK